MAATLTPPRSGRNYTRRVTLASYDVQRPPPAAEADDDAAAAAPAEPVLRLRGAGHGDAFASADGEVTGDLALKGAVLHRLQAMHRCRWSAAPAQRRGLAAAGAAGVLRVLRVRATPQSSS